MPLLISLLVPLARAEHRIADLPNAKSRTSARPDSKAPGLDDEALRKLVLRAWYKKAEPITFPLDELLGAAAPLLLDAFHLIPDRSNTEKVYAVWDLLTSEPDEIPPPLRPFLKRLAGKDVVSKLRNLDDMLGGKDTPLGTKLQIVRRMLEAMPEENQLSSGRRDEIYDKLRRSVPVDLRFYLRNNKVVIVTSERGIP